MRPRTIIQKEVDGYSKLLKPISQKQTDWLFNEMIKWAKMNKNEYRCLECENTWKHNDTERPEHVICPVCKNKLRILKGLVYTYRQATHFYILDKHKNYQIARCFLVVKFSKSFLKPTYYITEVFQQWIREDGKNIVRSILRTYGWSFTHGWLVGSPMEIRKESNNHSVYGKLCPLKKVNKIVRRNGFTGAVYDYSVPLVIINLLKYPVFETLVKMKKRSFVIAYFTRGNSIDDLWPSIKIAFKNNYNLRKYNDIIIWIDHMKLLQDLGYDILSPKYICPKNLKKEHQRFVKKQEEKRKKETYKKLVKSIIEADKKYKEEKKIFFNLCFKNENVVVTPFKSVDQLYTESKTLAHCAFSNKYYEKTHSLLFSAHANNEPIETVEFDLSKMKIIHCGGHNNKLSKHHNDIVTLINNNISKIEKCIRQQHKNLK